MYTVLRKEGKVTIYDTTNVPIYSADEDSILLYQGPRGPVTARASQMTDVQLLVALATAIHIPTF